MIPAQDRTFDSVGEYPGNKCQFIFSPDDTANYENAEIVVDVTVVVWKQDTEVAPDSVDAATDPGVEVQSEAAPEEKTEAEAEETEEVKETVFSFSSFTYSACFSFPESRKSWLVVSKVF